jgi:hypothetical protein
VLSLLVGAMMISPPLLRFANEDQGAQAANIKEGFVQIVEKLQYGLFCSLALLGA